MLFRSMLIGFVIGLFLVNKYNHAKIQAYGFILSSIGLIVILLGYIYNMPAYISLIGFMIFELFLNAGPHLMTYIIPSQIFTIAERGSGSGIAASLGKCGAILGVLLIPILLKKGGIELVLSTSLVIQLLGALITYILGKKIMPVSKK